MKSGYGIVLLAAAVVVTGLVFARAEEAPPAAEHPLADDLTALREDVKALGVTLEAMKAEQERIGTQVDRLVRSRYEYRVEARHGGASREWLTRKLAELGAEQYEYVLETSDGLHIFRRRVLEEEE